ncbi:hypothetical protein BC938DRAFT_472577 [Jimgerdemannia flammicorona]|uniref:Uncharacterized protein n=1 Tax=Jimgerdemannia flammicorona TaxID=994334 RepID=A0A433Q5U3_9FUNG|nr:hypothetical protein BC938DRAFT_472577 [Jimgerdemannia flammicorona]
MTTPCLLIFVPGFRSVHSAPTMLASRLTFSKHALISRSFVCSIRFSQLYSTTTKSQLANHRMLSTKSNHDNKTLVYIGPSTNTIRNYKMTASMFGICGLVTIPALLWMGQAHIGNLYNTLPLYPLYDRQLRGAFQRPQPPPAHHQPNPKTTIARHCHLQRSRAHPRDLQSIRACSRDEPTVNVPAQRRPQKDAVCDVDA